MDCRGITLWPTSLVCGDGKCDLITGQCICNSESRIDETFIKYETCSNAASLLTMNVYFGIYGILSIVAAIVVIYLSWYKKSHARSVLHLDILTHLLFSLFCIIF